MNTQDITVDLSKKNVKPESIVLRQGDKSGTTLRVKVLDNGVNVSSLDGYTAKFIMKLPYNRFYYEVEGTISGSMLTFVIDESYAAVQSGVTNIAYVALVNGETTRMSANNIRVEILPSALDGFTPPPEWTNPIDDFIEEQTARVNTIVNNAETATTAANTAATNANDKAALANTAATNANNKAGLADEAATNANAKAQAADEAAQAADEAREAIQDDLAAKANNDGYYQLLGAGTSDTLMSTDGEVDTFAQRTSDHDGACRIDCIKGNTIVWNSLVGLISEMAVNASSVTMTRANGVVTLAFDGSITGSYKGLISPSRTAQLVEGHKYFYYLEVRNNTTGKTVGISVAGTSSNGISPTATSEQTSGSNWVPVYRFGTSMLGSGNSQRCSIFCYSADSGSIEIREGSVFGCDLTLMFGAGNEPTTLEELSKYINFGESAYNTGTFLSVNIEGIKSIGFNQWDEEWEPGAISNGSPTTSTSAIRSKNYSPCIPNQTYYAKCGSYTNNYYLRIWWYDSDKEFISGDWICGTEKTAPANARFFKISTNTSTYVYGNVYNHDICVNLSDSSRNGTYEPYRGIIREIPPSTLFPDGILRSAGTAYDERTPTRDIKRVGIVDLGTLNWEYVGGTDSRFRVSYPQIKPTPSNAGYIAANMECIELAIASSDDVYNHVIDKSIGFHSSLKQLWVYDSTYTDAASFKAAMNGVMLYYELATPTETAIDPPLNLAYPVEQGGTESIVIPTGEMSAAPTMAVVYAYNADGVRDISQAIVANIESNTASTNYAIGGYFVYAGKLHRVTSAIATGEMINPGTNCVQTTVMAELIALTA